MPCDEQVVQAALAEGTRTCVAEEKFVGGVWVYKKSTIRSDVKRRGEKNRTFQDYTWRVRTNATEFLIDFTLENKLSMFARCIPIILPIAQTRPAHDDGLARV